MEEEHTRLVNERQAEMVAAGHQIGINAPLTKEHLLQEIFATMSHRKKLHSHVNRLESEVSVLQQQYASHHPNVCFKRSFIKVISLYYKNIVIYFFNLDAWKIFN